MSNANAPTRSVVVQTKLRVIENPEEGALVVSDRGCQTAIVAHPSSSDLNLLPLLEFIPYSEIHKGGIKVIKLPRKALLQFNLSGDLPTKVGSEVTYKSALKKSFSSNVFSTLHLPLHQPSIQMAKAFEDQDCQTDLTVSPYILEEDSVANVRREIGAQTSVTFEPSASISEVEPRLKEYLSHSHCFIAVYLHGQFTNLEDYQKQTGGYEPAEEIQITESVSDVDDGATKTAPQQTEISVGETQKTEKDSLEYRHMTDEEFEENIGKILNRTVKKVTVLMNRVVEVYERTRSDSPQKPKSREPQGKETEPSEGSLYFSAGSEEVKTEPEEVKEVNTEPEEVKEDEGSNMVQLLEQPNEETASAIIEPKIEDVVEIEWVPHETDIKVETGEEEEKQMEEKVAPDVKDVKSDLGGIKSDDIEPVVRRIVEELLERRGPSREQIASSPVGDTPEIKRKTHIECECAHPSEAGAAPPILSPPSAQEEEPQKAEGKEKENAVTLELVVTKGDGTVQRDSLSCPETCKIGVPCSDPKERIIRLSVVLPSQQHTCQCKTTDDKTTQGTQPDTQIYAGQKPSCAYAPQSANFFTPGGVQTEEGFCGDLVLKTCGEEKKEEECEICFEEDLFNEKICACLSMQSFEQDPVGKISEEKNNEAQLCECTRPLPEKPKFCLCFELPHSDEEDDPHEYHHTCGKVCSVGAPFLKGDDKGCTCGGEPVEIIYPERQICSCYEVRSGSSGFIFEAGEEERAPSEVCSYCRNLQEAAPDTPPAEEDQRSAISCTCGKNSSEFRPPEKDAVSQTASRDLKLLGIGHPEGQGKSIGAQTAFVEDSVRLIYQQSRNIVEPYMDKLRDIKVEAPQAPEPSLLYLRDRRSIEQYMKTLDPEDARDVMMTTKIPVPKKSSVKNVRSKQMTLVAVEISSTSTKKDQNLTVLATAWKVEDDLHTDFESSVFKDTLTYVTNEEEVEVVERDSNCTPLQSTCSAAVGPENSEKQNETVTVKDSVKFLFVSAVEHTLQVSTPTQSRPILEAKLTPPAHLLQSSNPELLSNLDAMPCFCKQGAKGQAPTEPTPNLTCLFEDDSEYHEGYMEEMTDESMSVQTQLEGLGGRVPLLECAASLPDMLNDTNRCDSKMEMPWLRISLPPAGFYQIEKMEGRPKRRTCDCWKLDAKDSVFQAEPIVQRVICPARTPDEFGALTLDENTTGDSDDAEEGTPGLGIMTDRTEAEGTLEEELVEDPPLEGEDQSQADEEGDLVEDQPPEGEKQRATHQSDKKVCVCLSAVEEDECAEFKKPTQFVYDSLCYEANEAYMDALYKLYPDDCDTECGSKTEIPWQDIVLPKRVKLRATKKKKSPGSEDPRRESEPPPLFADMRETPSRAKSERSTKSDKSVQSQRSAVKTDVSKVRKRETNAADSAFEIELNFAQVVSNLFNIDGGAATQATVSQISAISDLRMTPKRCPKDYIITVRTATGIQQRYGDGRMQTVGSQPFEFQIDQATASNLGVVITESKIPQKTKSCEIAEARNDDSSAAETTRRKVESMPDVPSKSSNVSEAFVKFLTIKSSDQKGGATLTGSYKSMGAKISKESGASKTKDPILVMVRSTGSAGAQDITNVLGTIKTPVRSMDSKESRGTCRSLGAKDPALETRSAGSKQSRYTCRSLEPKYPPVLGVLDMKTSVKETRTTDRSFGAPLDFKPKCGGACKSLGHKELDVKTPVRCTSSKESRNTGRSLETPLNLKPPEKWGGACRSLGTKEIKRPVVTCRDPIMEALETYQQEMKPLRETLNKLKAKIRDLNLPELSSWTCRPQKSHPVTPVPCTSIYSRGGGVRYPPNAPYGVPPPNMQMPFGMGPYYPQFNFVPPQNMYLQPPPQQFQPYPSSRTVACKGGRSKSKTRRRHRRHASSKSSSEVSDYSSVSGDDVKCPFLGATSAVSCASLPKTCSKVRRRSSKAACACQKRKSKTRRNQTFTERIERGTRTEPEVKVHLPPPRNTGHGKCRAAQQVVDKTPPYVKDHKTRVAVRIAPSGGGRRPEVETPSGEDSCVCRD